MKAMIFSVSVVVASCLTLCVAHEVTYQNIMQRSWTSVHDTDGDFRRTFEELGPQIDELSIKQELLKLSSGLGPGGVTSLLRAAGSVSNACSDSLGDLTTGLLERQTWALKMLDAQGRPGAGILEGNLMWLGGYDECKNVTALSADPVFRGRYCLTLVGNGAALKANPMAALKLGLCVPDTCTSTEVNIFLNNVVLAKLKVNGTVAYAICKGPNPLDNRAKVAIAILSVLVLLVVLGTLLDVARELLKPSAADDADLLKTTPVNAEEPAPGDSSSDHGARLRAEEYAPLLGSGSSPAPLSQPPLPVRILLCFSAYSNGRRLLGTAQPEGSLTSLHGIRFLSMTWVMLGHTYGFAVSWFDNMAVLPDVMKRWSFQAIANAFFSVDSFFVLSGLLVTYMYMRERQKKGRVSFPMFYFHRFWRLTPAYMLVMMIDICLGRYASDGPLYPDQTGFEVNFCKDTWWSNLLYINNLYKPKEMCMGWSWYLANDMQFFVISPLILIPLGLSVAAGAGVISVFVLVHILTNAIMTDVYKYPGGMLNPNQGAHNLFDDLYIKPYARVGPYVIGMAVGYLLFRLKGRLRMHKLLVLLGWVVAAVVALAAVYGTRKQFTGHPLSVSESAAYNALGRLAWAAALGWVIVACCTGNGGFVNTLLSWKGFIPLSRLTYSAYLVHPIIMFVINFTRRAPLHFTDSAMIYVFLGHVVMAYGCGVVASLVFEAPMMQLEKIFFGRK